MILFMNIIDKKLSPTPTNLKYTSAYPNLKNDSILIYKLILFFKILFKKIFFFF